MSRIRRRPSRGMYFAPCPIHQVDDDVVFLVKQCLTILFLPAVSGRRLTHSRTPDRPFYSTINWIETMHECRVVKKSSGRLGIVVVLLVRCEVCTLHPAQYVELTTV